MLVPARTMSKSLPRKSAKSSAVTVPKDRILQHADQVYRQQLSSISFAITDEKHQERRQLLEELDAKWKAQEEARKKEALEHHELIKKSIAGSIDGSN